MQTGTVKRNTHNFVDIHDARKKDICQDISSSYDQLVTRNRAIFKVIAETVILCGKQNIALRGHEEDRSNFKALLKFRAQKNTVC